VGYGTLKKEKNISISRDRGSTSKKEGDQDRFLVSPMESCGRPRIPGEIRGSTDPLYLITITDYDQTIHNHLQDPVGR